jgi:hypothetical protein
VTVPTPVTFTATAGGVSISTVLMVLPSSGAGGTSTQTFTGRADRNTSRTHNVTVSASGTVSATLSWNNARAPLSLTVRNPAGATVATRSGASPIQLSFAATQTGTHAFVVSNPSSQEKADYTLQVMPPAVPANGSDTTPPTVAVTFPPVGAKIHGTQILGASVSENGTVARVDFFADAQLVGTAVMPPWAIKWDTRATADGPKTLTARAVDGVGLSGTSAGRSVTVANANAVDVTPPTVAMSWPMEGDTLRDRTSNLQAVASDNVGVTRVEFYVDGALYLVDTILPYSNTLFISQVGDGPHVLTARAFDEAGNSTLSAPRNIVVQSRFGPAPVSPTITITNPAPGATVSGTVPIDTSVSNDVTQVQFFVDGALLATDGGAPFSTSWNTAGLSGSHTLTAQASNAAGGTGNASPVTVTVGAPPPPGPRCGDNVVNQPTEQCDGTSSAACPGLCLANCTCCTTATTCAAQGKDCGTIPDGCGGTLTCGTCTAPQTCGGSGVANVCGGGSTATLTLTATGRGGERVSSTPAGLSVPTGSTASATFATGTSITLQATNQRDVIWSSVCSSGGQKTKTCTFTLNATATETASVQ